MRKRPLLALLLPLCLSAGLGEDGDYNALILESIQAMPSAGEYSRYQKERPESERFLELYETVDDLQKAIRVGLGGRLKIDPKAAAGPSFCSSATYLLFCDVIARLQEREDIPVNARLNRELADVGQTRAVIHGEMDGVGLFGHWNANGPGTAVLFERLDLGPNFSSFERARPGDFLKIFWNDKIGKGERGHLVVFLGMSEDGEAIEVWSSNLENEDETSGYGTMWVDRDRIHRSIFSRLEHPENLSEWLRFSEAEKTSDYLVRILSEPSSGEEMKRVTRSED